MIIYHGYFICSNISLLRDSKKETTFSVLYHYNTANYDYLPWIFYFLKYFFTGGLKKKDNF